MPKGLALLARKRAMVKRVRTLHAMAQLKKAAAQIRTAKIHKAIANVRTKKAMVHLKTAAAMRKR